ncbi:MAG: N-acetyltransferase [Alphaproteobacteria bacterium]|nr:N-acetyltransferase [Alphaproteobacteria bacterium]
MSNTLTFNEKDSRYEQIVDGYTVYATTHRKGDILYIDYVFAPPELRGKGAAGAFMKELMEEIRKNRWKAVPVCGFAAGWLRKHGGYNNLVQSA